MSELILELYTEEIPALMQKNAEEAYYNIFSQAFETENIMYQSMVVHVGPRRVVLYVQGLPVKSIAKHVEIKGPKTTVSSEIVEAFCKSNNISRKDLSTKLIKDQEHYIYSSVLPEIDMEQILPKILNDSISSYIWPKSMCWADYEMRWVRPMQNIMCLFNNKILDFSYFHLKANNKSFGHRFIAQDSFTVSNWEEYISNLSKKHMIIESNIRLSMIKHGISIIEAKHNLVVELDQRLLEEVCGLVEYPNVLIGKIPEKFMNVPNEMLSLAMKTHQRYFTTRNNDGSFAPYFVFVTNLPDGGSEIVQGNERVLSARLADAAYFYNQDQKVSLESRVPQLKNVIFHAKLGSMYDKTMRLLKLVKYIAPINKDVSAAALICKCDLTTEAVSEFPELQGVMGGYYAFLEGLNTNISSAIKNHYLPLGNNDSIPTGDAAYLALVDKMDSLVSLMCAGERATGSKDPYALRRYSLGVIKIILRNNFEGLKIVELISTSYKFLAESGIATEIVKEDIVRFIEERFKYFLKDEYDINIINAVVDLSVDDDLCNVLKKVKALHNFISSSSSSMVIQLYKRVTNVLEEQSISGDIDVDKFSNREEKDLYEAIINTKPKIMHYIKTQNFEQSFYELGLLSDVIAKFFENIMVNDSNKEIANNRKLLLSSVASIFNQIAKFEKL